MESGREYLTESISGQMHNDDSFQFVI